LDDVVFRFGGYSVHKERYRFRKEFTVLDIDCPIMRRIFEDFCFDDVIEFKIGHFMTRAFGYPHTGAQKTVPMF
jgi:hypothetical protein